MSTWPFLAEIDIFPYQFSPLGYVFCEGQLMPISQYGALFSLVGTLYGGDGRTTFGVPSLEGRSPMHWGTGPGLTPCQIGDYGGLSTVILDPDQLPKHNHSWTVIKEGNPDNTQNPEFTMGLAMDGDSGNGAFMYSTTAGQADTDMSLDSVGIAGSDEGHENRQPWLGLYFFMAIDGEYPMRS